MKYLFQVGLNNRKDRGIKYHGPFYLENYFFEPSFRSVFIPN